MLVADFVNWFLRTLASWELLSELESLITEIENFFVLNSVFWPNSLFVIILIFFLFPPSIAWCSRGTARVHGLLGLSRTVAELSVQLLGYELVSQPSAVCILGGVLGELRIVSTCSSLVSSCVLGYIGETICRWRCNLSFSSWRISSF